MNWRNGVRPALIWSLVILLMTIAIVLLSIILDASHIPMWAYVALLIVGGIASDRVFRAIYKPDDAEIERQFKRRRHVKK